MVAQIEADRMTSVPSDPGTMQQAGLRRRRWSFRQAPVSKDPTGAAPTSNQPEPRSKRRLKGKRISHLLRRRTANDNDDNRFSLNRSGRRRAELFEGATPFSSTDHPSNRPDSLSLDISAASAAPEPKKTMPESVSVDKTPPPSEQNNTVDVGSFSDYSQESLLSAWSSEEESINSECRGYERAKKRFRRRNRRLRQLSQGKRSLYNALLWQMENASREHYLEERKLPKEEREQFALSPSPSMESKQSSFNNLRTEFLFECFHLPEGIWSIFVFCFGNAACACVFDKISNIGLKLTGIGEYQFYITQILASLLVMRINGYLWWWVGHDAYRLVKFDLHNRLELGFWDAKFMKYMSHPKRNAANSLINMISFYAFYTGVYFFYLKAYGNVELSIWSWYKTVGQAASLPIDDFVAFQECDLIWTEVASFWKRPVMYHICTDPEWTLLMGSFHVLALSLATVLAYMTGASLLMS